MTLADNLALLSDAELESMKNRSWRRAASLWSESRAARSNVVRNMIGNDAFSEEEFYNACLAEQSRRKDAAKEVPA